MPLIAVNFFFLMPLIAVNWNSNTFYTVGFDTIDFHTVNLYTIICIRSLVFYTVAKFKRSFFLRSKFIRSQCIPYRYSLLWKPMVIVFVRQCCGRAISNLSSSGSVNTYISELFQFQPCFLFVEWIWRRVTSCGRMATADRNRSLSRSRAEPTASRIR
jgi:hypothetical protein